MNDTKQQPRRMRQLLGRVAPGIDTLSRYRITWLPSDVAAGLSVTAVALPVGIAYADIAGVPAVIGMYSAIFPLFAYALFGSSRQLMTGPDAATCMLMAAALAPLAGGDTERYLALVTAMTLSAGLVYLLAGTARLGFIARFLSQPILVGFMNGIALLIIVGQLDKLFGYQVQAGDFLGKLAEHIERLPTAHLPTLLLGLGALAGLVALRRFLPRLPGALVVMVVGIALAAALGLEQQGVAVLGAVPSGLPDFFHIPLLPAAVIIVSAAGLFDAAMLRKLAAISRVELALSVGTTLGVLVLGALPGVLLAVVLSLLQLLALSSRPTDAVLGRVPGLKGFHDIADYPEAKTVPGLLLYRFEANLVFYNVDYFRERLLGLIDAAKIPLEWVVIDGSSINLVDSTAIDAVDRIRDELAARGIVLASANVKRSLGRRFRGEWIDARRALDAGRVYPTLKSAVRAFEQRATAHAADASGSGASS